MQWDYSIVMPLVKAAKCRRQPPWVCKQTSVVGRGMASRLGDISDPMHAAYVDKPFSLYTTLASVLVTEASRSSRSSALAALDTGMIQRRDPPLGIRV